jgi:hypothetical protein
LPRLTLRPRSVSVTDASIDEVAAQQKTPEKSLAESERWRHIHRQPKTRGNIDETPEECQSNRREPR